MCQAYAEGVSTRRADGLVRSKGIDGMSQPQVSEMAESFDARVAGFRNRPHDDGPTTYVWLDVLFHKIGDGGRVVGVATVIATGINVDGHREVLGVDVITTRLRPSCSSMPRAACGPLPASPMNAGDRWSNNTQERLDEEVIATEPEAVS